MLAIVNAKVRTCGPQGTLDQGTILIQGTKIQAVGTDLDIPSDARVIDARGSILTPGFVDAHTHIGISWQELAGEADTNENTSAVNAHLRALDSVNPQDVAFDDAVLNGVTTVMALPGKLMIGPQGLSPIAGQAVVLKTHGTIGHRQVLRDPAGIKLALGDAVSNFLSNRGIGPNSRMGIAALLRNVLRQAQDYQALPDPSGKRDLTMEALLPLLSCELPAHVHVHRADDILAMLRIADEFDLDLVLHHATEAHLITGELAKRGIPCVVGPLTLARETRRELKHLHQRNPGLLAAAGIKVALMTDHPTEPVQFLPIIAGEAVREGMEPDKALKAITLYAAEILGVADRVGSIESGKDADVVLHDGDPLEAMTHIRLVVADGEVVKDELCGLHGDQAEGEA